MGQIEDLDLFTKIVDLGSISRAAEALNIAKSAVSRRLALLEDRYAATLIERRPGHWAVTDRGQALYERARPLLADAEALAGDFTDARLAQAGPLHLSLPRDFGLAFLAEPIRAFAKAYPEIRLHLSFDDRLTDLSNENFDAAIRITPKPPQDVQAYCLGQSRTHLVASPAYLAEAAALNSPDDLPNHRILGYGTGGRVSLPFGGKAQDLSVSYASNTGTNLRDAAIDGLGLVALPDFLCSKALADGNLRTVLDDYPLPDLTIYLCMPLNARPSLRLKRFRAHIQNLFAEC